MDVLFSVFGILAYIIWYVVIFIIIRKTLKLKKGIISNIQVNPTDSGTILKCSKCGEVLKDSDNFCTNCGEPVVNYRKVLVNISNFDKIYDNTDDKLLEEFINRQLSNVDFNIKSLIPIEVFKRKRILNIIFSVLLFIYISLIFFHFPIYTYIIGGIILIVFTRLANKYDFMKYLKKEVKSRPNEKILNIIMNMKNSSVDDNTKVLRLVSSLIAIILPLLIFMNPRIIYEESINGYTVRFYTFGITNYKTAVIPESYKGKKVVGLRGNTFSNMPFLEKITLPNSIVEIRGQAFKNDYSLYDINIPSSLEYLGGGAFYNCSSLKSISLPDTLNYMGGEAFYGASSMEYIKLSEILSEIKGETFEYCESLKSIKIPDNVVRIGGHAFYGNNNLSEVTFTNNSKLMEIGSSAFRQCPKLYEITIPNGVYVNERAFKESPTTINYFNSNSNDYYDFNF